MARFSLAGLFTAALLAVSGCATTLEQDCARHEQEIRETKPVTTYRFVEPKPNQRALRTLPAGSTAQVSTYRLSFRPTYTTTCHTITLRKSVVIQRSIDNDVVLTEIREFYADDGSLITTSSENITDQVRRSGNYLATTPLPVPKAAPPGKYRIVNKLMFDRRGKGRAPVPIARGEGFFFIVPRETEDF